MSKKKWQAPFKQCKYHECQQWVKKDEDYCPLHRVGKEGKVKEKAVLTLYETRHEQER